MADYPDHIGILNKIKEEVGDSRNANTAKNNLDFIDSPNCNINSPIKEKMKIVVKYADKMKNKISDVVDSSNEEKGTLPAYSMCRSKTGVALVINNITFENNNVNEKLERRNGADVDAENLEELFTQMGFVWIYWKNLTLKEMNRKLKEFTSNQILNEVDSCFVFVMSHGGQGRAGPEDTHIYTYDNQKITANEIIRKFSNSNCKLLQDKPKFIIFQACRGDLKDLALATQPGNVKNCQKTTATESDCPSHNHFQDFSFFTQTESVSSEKSIDISEKSDRKTITVESNDTPITSSKIAPTTNSKIETNTKTIPGISDIFIYYTTSPGYLSFRDSSRGAWFIQCFCEVFMNRVYNTDVRSLFDEITAKLIEKKTHDFAIQIADTRTRGKFRPCFLFPSLRKIVDNLEEKLEDFAEELDQMVEKNKINNALQKLCFLG